MVAVCQRTNRTPRRCSGLPKTCPVCSNGEAPEQGGQLATPVLHAAPATAGLTTLSRRRYCHGASPLLGIPQWSRCLAAVQRNIARDRSDHETTPGNSGQGASVAGSISRLDPYRREASARVRTPRTDAATSIDLKLTMDWEQLGEDPAEARACFGRLQIRLEKIVRVRAMTASPSRPSTSSSTPTTANPRRTTPPSTSPCRSGSSRTSWVAAEVGTRGGSTTQNALRPPELWPVVRSRQGSLSCRPTRPASVRPPTLW